MGARVFIRYFPYSISKHIIYYKPTLSYPLLIRTPFPLHNKFRNVRIKKAIYLHVFMRPYYNIALLL